MQIPVQRDTQKSSDGATRSAKERVLGLASAIAAGTKTVLRGVVPMTREIIVRIADGVRNLPFIIFDSIKSTRQVFRQYSETISRLDETEERELSAVPRRSTDVRQPIVNGFIILLITFGGFGGWAAVAPIARGASAMGTVSLDGNRKQIQHLEGGIVQEILVRDGDRVEAGQVLFRLDNTRDQAQSGVYLSRRDEMLAMEARLIAEKNGDEEITFPQTLMERKDEPHVADLMQDQRDLFESRKQEIYGQVDILQQRIEQYEQQIEGMISQRDSNKRQASLIEEELVGLRKLLKQGFSSRTRVLALERAAANLKGEGGAMTANIAKAEVAIGETKLQMLQLKQQQYSDVIDQMRKVRAQVADIDGQLASSKDRLQRTEIRSPVDGQMVGITIHTKGGVITPGSVLGYVVPEGDKLVIDAQVKITDIESVHGGMDAEIRLPGLPLRTTPMLHGKVVTVSGDALEDKRSGMPYYMARVEVSNEELAKLGDTTLIPGMPAEVLIKAGERTVLEYMITPFSRIFATSMQEE